MDRLERPLVNLPLLRDPASYVPDTVDLTDDALARKYWLSCFEEALDGVRGRARPGGCKAPVPGSDWCGEASGAGPLRAGPPAPWGAVIPGVRGRELGRGLSGVCFVVYRALAGRCAQVWEQPALPPPLGDPGVSF